MFLLGGSTTQGSGSASRGSACGNGGVCIQEEGVCNREGMELDRPPGNRKAGGTHPIGMVSCLPCRKFKKVLSFTTADCLFSYRDKLNVM